jgi:hypothetical protein
MKRILLGAVLAISAALLASASVTSAAESADGYLHNIAEPARCAAPGQTPDPTQSVCSAHFFAPRVALTSQTVLLAISDFEASQGDCTSYGDAQTTTFAVDGAPVPITTQPCRYVPQSVDNVITLPVEGYDAVWDSERRYLIPAGSLAPGVHTLTWTSTFTSDWSYSLGCGDPSGRCTVPAGSVDTATTTLTVMP